MLDVVQGLVTWDVARQIGASLVVLVIALGIRAGGRRWIQRNTRMSGDERLRWSIHLRTIMVLVLILGLLFLWGRELREFTVSLVALGAAVVLATKELLMCITGALHRTTSSSFEIGDRIEIAGIRGDVIDHTLLSTTLLEIGPSHQRTGRTQVLPNSLFLTQSVANETFTDEFVLHSFGVRVERAHLAVAEPRLLNAAREVCGGYVEEATRHMDSLGRRHGLPSFNVEPKVTVHLDEVSSLTLLVRVPTPARERGSSEQAILRQFLRVEEEEGP